MMVVSIGSSGKSPLSYNALMRIPSPCLKILILKYSLIIAYSKMLNSVKGCYPVQCLENVKRLEYTYMIRLRVKEVAESKGYNMSSLSRATDISFTTIKRLWTKPTSGANINTLSKIAKVLGVSISDLTEEIDDKP